MLQFENAPSDCEKCLYERVALAVAMSLSTPRGKKAVERVDGARRRVTPDRDTELRAGSGLAGSGEAETPPSARPSSHFNPEIISRR
jgi:hypothetical protein